MNLSGMSILTGTSCYGLSNEAGQEVTNDPARLQGSQWLLTKLDNL